MEAHDDSTPWLLRVGSCTQTFPLLLLVFLFLSLDTVAHFFLSYPLLSPFLSLLLPPPVGHGFPPAGDFLLPEPRRSHGVCGHLPAGPVQRVDSGQRGAQPPVRHFTTAAQTQRIQETGTVPSASARVLLPDIVHHQCMWYTGMRRYRTNSWFL